MDLLIKTNENLSWYKNLSEKELSSLGFEMDNALQNEDYLKNYNKKMNAPIPLRLKEDVKKMINFVGAKIEEDSEVHYVDY